MIDPREVDDDGSLGFENLESLVFAARNYVVPSDDLRPRTMDAAREVGFQKKEVRRIGFAILVSCFIWSVCFGMASSAGIYREHFVAPSGDEFQRAALRLAANTNGNIDWGLVEAFARMRGLRIHDLGSMQ